MVIRLGIVVMQEIKMAAWHIKTKILEANILYSFVIVIFSKSFDLNEIYSS